MTIRKENSKIKKHRVMMKSPKLRPHLPATEWLDSASTKRMLKSYPTVFIKPNIATGGDGIIRVRKIQDKYEVCYGSTKKIVNHKKLYPTIQSFLLPNKKYIIQKGIPLGRYKGSLFDVRVYMQKPKNRWIYSGKVARIAASNRFITNYHKGGSAETLEKVLNHLFSNKKSKVRKCTAKVKDIAHTISEMLDRRFPGIRHLGLDIGIESNGHIWIIEANTKPAHFLFKQLQNKTMLHRILRNKRIIMKRYS